MSNRRRIYYLFGAVALSMLAVIFALKLYGNQSFEKTATGLLYKVVQKGEGPQPKEGEIVFLNMHYETEKGETIFNTADHDAPAVLQYDNSLYQKDGGFREAISMLQKGDSITFKVKAKALLEENFEPYAAKYALKEDAHILLHLKLENIMTEDQFKKWEAEQRAELQKKQQARAEAQHKKDEEAIERYVSENSITTQKATSGLQYVIDVPGQGPKPQQGDTVKVNYTGYLLDGKVFDTSLEELAKKHNIHNPLRPYEPIEFQLGAGQVIQGWDEGIMLLSKGSKARLFIPSTLAYGERAMGDSIPANAVLLFEVELVDFTKKGK
jgi:FKBP-type peptidyl-prolyl cis-trans isomerase FkpA